MNMSKEDRQKGQRASVQKRNAHRTELAQRRQAVDKLIDWADRENLPNAALAATLTAIQRGAQALDAVPLETALDVLRSAEAARIWHSLMRLELGESTSNVATAAVNPEELAARLAKVREQDTQP